MEAPRRFLAILIMAIVLASTRTDAQEDHLQLTCVDELTHVFVNGKREVQGNTTKPAIYDFYLLSNRCPTTLCTITDRHLQFTREGEYGYTITIDRATGDFKAIGSISKTSNAETFQVNTYGKCQPTQRAF